jgi:hypothetical protein
LQFEILVLAIRTICVDAEVFAIRFQPLLTVSGHESIGTFRDLEALRNRLDASEWMMVFHLTAGDRRVIDASIIRTSDHTSPELVHGAHGLCISALVVNVFAVAREDSREEIAIIGLPMRKHVSATCRVLLASHPRVLRALAFAIGIVQATPAAHILSANILH